MRVTACAIVVLGLGVAVAYPQDRAAVLKAPEPIRPGDQPPVARGAAEPLPANSFPTTPVARPTGSRPGVAGVGDTSWLTGVDPNLIRAGGTAGKTNAVRPLTPPSAFTKDEGATQPKLLDRFKGAVSGGDKPAAPKPLPQSMGQPAQQPPQQVTAATPFRGTGANGAPVYAGPPAYRWYGWGSVTPGSNPLAPAGQYPRASANWYSLTGATPGAFPVPVSNGAPVTPGIDPPTYGTARTQPAPQPVVPVSTPPVIQYDTPRYSPPPATGSKFMPGPAPTTPVSVPTIPTPPAPKPVAAAPVVVPPPDMTPPLIPPAVTPKVQPVAKLPELPPLPPVPAPTPVAVSVIPAVPPVEAVPVPLPAVEPKPLETAPPVLPPSVTEVPAREEPKWAPTEKPIVQPGTWAPAPDAQPLPTMTPGEQTSRAPGKPIVVRAQGNESSPDPLATLIKQLCQGRADGVEVRYTGTKKLQVCFEIRGATEAQKLVNDISKRPELTAYQIDFCVFVK